MSSQFFSTFVIAKSTQCTAQNARLSQINFFKQVKRCVHFSHFLPLEIQIIAFTQFYSHPQKVTNQMEFYLIIIDLRQQSLIILSTCFKR